MSRNTSRRPSSSVPGTAVRSAKRCLLRVELLEDRTVPYATSDPAAGANGVHEYLTDQGYSLFARQFGATDFQNGSFRIGAHDEDVDALTITPVPNPFGDYFPYLRHFWAHNLDYSRAVPDGLLAYDAAPNRAVKYFTGGVGVDGNDTDWGKGQGAVAGRGITWQYTSGTKRMAFEWLGHVAHLLQDMTVPAHAHSDPHLEIKPTDFDPYHNYVDGEPLAKAGIEAVDKTYVAAFDSQAGPRYMVYASIDGQTGAAIRTAAAVGGMGTDTLVRLFRENADTAAKYDTKDYVGSANGTAEGAAGRGTVVKVGLGSGGNRNRIFDKPADYNQFTEAELQEQAGKLVPLAVTSTAELIRYFYAQVDKKAPAVALYGLSSTDATKPQVLPTSTLRLEAVGTDADTGNSGVGKDLFRFEYAPVDAAGKTGTWKALAAADVLPGTTFADGKNPYGAAYAGKPGSAAVTVVSGLTSGVYAVRATGEDGAGNRGATKDLLYVRIPDAVRVGIITTYAGSGVYPGPSPYLNVRDGGLATAAILVRPEFVTIDNEGHLFIADPLESRVRQVDLATGIISTVANIYDVCGIAADKFGNLYIADPLREKVWKLNLKTGVATTVAGNGQRVHSGDGGPATSASFVRLCDVAIDEARHLFISDMNSHRIRMVNLTTGVITTVAGTGKAQYNGDGGPAAFASLYNPTCLATDNSGHLFISDTNNCRVRRIDLATGIITTVAGDGVWNHGQSGDGGLATLASVFPSGVTVDPAGNLFVSQIGDYRVRKVSAGTGIITTVAGTGESGFSGDGGLATAAKLQFPSGIVADSSGQLYVADSGNRRVRTITPSGVATNRATTTTFNTSFANPLLGGNVTLTSCAATLSGPAPTGYIAFVDDTTKTLLGTAVLSFGAATLITSFATVGTHTVTARYTGDGNSLPSAGTVTVTVTRRAATIALAASASTIDYGKPVTLTATITAPAGAVLPPGTLSFYAGGKLIREDDHKLSDVKTYTDGGPYKSITRSLTASTLPAGVNIVTAVYRAFDGILFALTSKVTVTVTARVTGTGVVRKMALVTAADGLRLLAAGRKTALPWANLTKLTLTLDAPLKLAPADVTVAGIAVANYGPVKLSLSGNTYTIILAKPITGPDRVTVTVRNAALVTYTRRLDVLPGDANDDGVVTEADATLIDRMIRPKYLPTAFGDANGDGVVDQKDIDFVRTRIGTRLP